MTVPTLVRRLPRRRFLALASAVVGFALWLGAASDGFAQSCEDWDSDGFPSIDGCAATRDCNDDDPAIHPGAPEHCDVLDNDCDGFVDDHIACDRVCDNPQKMPGATRVSVDDLWGASQGRIVWVGDGWVITYIQRTGESCWKLMLRRLDPVGAPVGPPVDVSGGGPGETVQTMHPDLTWTGNEILVTWGESPIDGACYGVVGPHRQYFQRFTSGLRKIGAKTRAGCQASDSDDLTAVWSGAGYGLVWNELGGIRFTPVDRDGVPVDVCGTVISGEDNHASPSLAWNGQGYGVTYRAAEPNTDYLTIFDEIYFRRVAADASLPDVGPTRLTYDPARSQWNSLVWADGGWAVSWSDDRASAALFTEVYFARMNDLGQKVDPPGDIRLTCCNDDTSGFTRYFNELAWTGAEYGLGYAENSHPTDVTGDVFFRRADAQGNPVGTPVLMTPDTAKRAGHVDLAWNGTTYGMVWYDRPQGVNADQVYFGRVGCNCADADGDGFSSCAGGDCNDGSVLVNPAKPESCLDGQDNNCDGKNDCQDTTACTVSSGAVPGEIGGLGFASDKATVSWAPDSTAQTYDVLQGDLGSLRDDGDFRRAQCLVWRHPATSYADGAVPLPGKGRYYLVRGKADRCRLGTWGSSTRDVARVACP